MKNNNCEEAEREIPLQVLRNYQLTRQTWTLGEFYNIIRTGVYRSVTDAVRRHVAKGEIDRANGVKNTMPAVCVSGQFEGRRVLACLTRYLPFMAIDIDDLDSTYAAELLRNRAMKLPFTLMAFVTAKGRGVKLICHTPGNPENLSGDALKRLHSGYYNALAAFYERELGCKVDRSGSDITRTVLASTDSNARRVRVFPNTPYKGSNFPYTAVKPSAGTIPPAEGETPAEGAQTLYGGDAENTSPEGTDNPATGAAETRTPRKRGRKRLKPLGPEALMSYCTAELKRQGAVYEEGNRNNYLYRLARKLNAYGMERVEAERLITRNYNLPEREALAAVCSAYEGHPDEHATRNPWRTSGKREELMTEVEHYIASAYRLRFNVVTRRLEWSNTADGEFEPMEDYRENSIFRDLTLRGLHITHRNLEYLLRSDFVPTFNPFTDYLESLPGWDGETDHIAALASTVTVEGDDERRREWVADFKRWFVAMVASWVSPEAINHVALILVGAQGVYKTTWITSLLPPRLKPYLYTGPFNPYDKDHILNLSRCALINCEEIEALTGDRLNRFKSILTQGSTNERAAYGRNTEYRTRCASFAGSTNQTELIGDPTGMRRWLIVAVKDIVSPFKHPFYYAGVYAQAYALYLKGFRYWSNTDDVKRMNRHNEHFEIRSTEEEMVMTYLHRPEEGEPYQSLTATQIVQILEVHTKVPISKIRIGKALLRCGFDFHVIRGVKKYHVVEFQRDEVEEMKNL